MEAEAKNGPPCDDAFEPDSNRTKTVLVVDDEEINCELMRELLERRGYSVCEAYDGGKAVTLIEEELPDLVLLDIHMPILNGFQVLDRVRKDPRLRSIPILAYTTVPREEESSLIQKGFDGLVTKPLDSISMNIIESYLGR